MVEFKNAAEAARLAQLVHEAERKKRDAKGLDRWGLPPVGKGCVRGRVANVKSWDEPCPFGMLQVIEFDLVDDPKEPGVPVRISGTDIDNRVMEGHVLDVQDRNPSIRPIPATGAVHSYSLYDGRGMVQSIKAYYPGRDDAPPRRNRVLAAMMVLVPVAITAAAVVGLHLLHIIQ